MGRGSAAVELADLNGDGEPDVVAADDRGSAVSVALNRGNGSFGPHAEYHTPLHPDVLQTADLNGDGKHELLTANRGRSFSVLLNRGNGTFQPRRDYATHDALHTMLVHDLNGDGKPDLASSNYTSSTVSTVSVFINGGDGRFQARSDYEIGPRSGLASIADLNGDGYPDMVAATSRNAVAVLLNRGDGHFEGKRDYPIGDGSGGDVEIADLNHDHKPDIVTANTGGKSNSLSVLLNGGSGSFEARRDYSLDETFDTVAIRDLNGDGHPDLLAYMSDAYTLVYEAGTDHVSVFLNRGDGSFAAEPDHTIGFLPSYPLDVVDVNGDNRPDLISANWIVRTDAPRGLWVSLNRGDGTFRRRRFYPTVTAGSRLPTSTATAGPNSWASTTTERTAAPRGRSSRSSLTAATGASSRVSTIRPAALT